MKDSVKKIFLVLCASTVVLASSAVFAAPTSGPSRKTDTISANDTVGGSTQTDSATDSGTDSSVTDNTSDSTSDTSSASDTATSGVTQGSDRPVPTAVSVGQEQTNTVQSSEAQKVTNKKYASKGSVAIWFILSILINAVLSFMIGNRFYKLAKKESHVTPEIRALRRDLEEKFANSVGGFSEMETDVVNTNDNYSMNGSIKMPDRKSTDFASDSEDVFKKWEDRMQQRRAPKRAVEAEDDIIEEEEEQPKRKFRPKREQAQPIDNEDEYTDEDSDEEYEDEEPSRLESAKKKAKGILGDLFPFKED